MSPFRRGEEGTDIRGILEGRLHANNDIKGLRGEVYAVNGGVKKVATATRTVSAVST